MAKKENKFIDMCKKPFMGMFGKKSYQTNVNLEDVFTLYGLGMKKGIGWLSALGAINYYNQISPIATAIDLISETASRVYIAVYDRKNKTYIKDEENNTKILSTPEKALKLLGRPNATETYSQFMRSLMSFYLITGNAFIISQSTANKTDIIKLEVAKPQDITIYGSGTSLATKYLWADGDRNITFNLNTTNFKYEGYDKKGFYYELKHIRCFNPKYNVSNLWGMSVLTQLYLEMEQYINGAVHNNALLENGVKPSGVLTLDEEMSDNAYERARKEFQSFYSGAENAGKVLIFEGNNAKFESFEVNPKDMDYVNLIDKVENALYSRLKIPRPLISDKAMTYNNLAEALRQLYILAVFPSFDLILEALSDCIFDRAKDGQDYEIYYDTKDIEAFAEKYAEIDERVIRLGITTYNEARNKFNLPNLDENGDTVFAPSSIMTPLGNVEQKKVSINEFKSILAKQGYNEQQIGKAIEKIYGKDI